VPSCYYPTETGYYVSKQSSKVWTKNPSSVKNPYCDDAKTLNFEQQEIGKGIRLMIGESDR
jgi:hypothetical protein